MPDHIHALIALPRTKTISDIMQSVKGASSRYINEQALTPTFFAWQTGFGVISVSPKDVKRIHQYILNQKNHHRDNNLEFEP